MREELTRAERERIITILQRPATSWAQAMRKQALAFRLVGHLPTDRRREELQRVLGLVSR
jgi:hypothetical protein